MPSSGNNTLSGWVIWTRSLKVAPPCLVGLAWPRPDRHVRVTYRECAGLPTEEERLQPEPAGHGVVPDPAPACVATDGPDRAPTAGGGQLSVAGHRRCLHGGAGAQAVTTILAGHGHAGAPGGALYRPVDGNVVQARRGLDPGAPPGGAGIAGGGDAEPGMHRAQRRPAGEAG